MANGRDRIRSIVDGELGKSPPDALVEPALESMIEDTVAYLASDAAAASLRADPYWPKWNSPWWHMSLLDELGLTRRIPRCALGAASRAVEHTYLKVFPIHENELEPGIDPYRNLMCHCALGTIYRIFDRSGFGPDELLPWARPWFLKYQLPDGGLNCDERAYAKAAPKSSVVSTLPPLEAMLRRRSGASSPEEATFVDQGVGYLLSHRICRSSSKDRVLIEPDWLEVCFPRFYHFDVLRGLALVVAWARHRSRTLPCEALVEVVEVVAGQTGDDGQIRVGRQAHVGEPTLALGADGAWSTGVPSTTFPLLETVSRVGRSCPSLTIEWREALSGLAELDRRGLLGE